MPRSHTDLGTLAELRTRRLALEPVCRRCVRPATEVTIRAGREPVAGLFDIEDTVALCVGCFGERPAGAPPPPTPPEPDKPCVKCGSRDRYIKTGKCRPCSHQRYRRRALAAAAAMRAAP